MNAEPEVNHLWFPKDEILTFQEENKKQFLLAFNQLIGFPLVTWSLQVPNRTKNCCEHGICFEQNADFVFEIGNTQLQ